MGGTSCGSRFPFEMCRLWASDYDCKKTGREEYEGYQKEGSVMLPSFIAYMPVGICTVLGHLLS